MLVASRHPCGCPASRRRRVSGFPPVRSGWRSPVRWRSPTMADQRHEWFMGRIFRHRGALHRYVSKLTSGAEDVEDLVQETYLRIYALPDFHTIELPKALLFRIAHNLVIERARRRKAQLTESVAD